MVLLSTFNQFNAVIKIKLQFFKLKNYLNLFKSFMERIFHQVEDLMAGVITDDYSMFVTMVSLTTI